MSIKMIFNADLVPTESNFDEFSKPDIPKIIDPSILETLEIADFRFFNLEVPLTDKVDPIDKCGPNLIAPTSTIAGIKYLNPSLLGLANNHTLDHGEQGLASTINLLDEYEIPHIGAGENLQKAYIPYIYKNKGKKIGIYTCAEHEFTIATDKSWGANPFDPFESLDHISDLKKECDYVVVLYHGGKEHYRYPSPYLQKACRKIVEKGADLIICQHTHCVGSYENYESSLILYGQGNFLFDHSDSEYWQTSVMVVAEFGDSMKVDFIPIVKDKNAIRLAKDNKKKEILENLHSRSVEIKKDGVIEKKYDDFVMELAPMYFQNILALEPYLKKVDQKLDYMLSQGKFDSIPKLMVLRGYMQCEPHRELVLRSINKLADNIKKNL